MDSEKFHTKQEDRVINKKAYKMLWKLIIVSRKLVTHETEQKKKKNNHFLMKENVKDTKPLTSVTFFRELKKKKKLE